MLAAQSLRLASRLILGACASLAAQQPKPVHKLDAMNLERAHFMLKMVRDEIKKD